MASAKEVMTNIEKIMNKALTALKQKYIIGHIKKHGILQEKRITLQNYYGRLYYEKISKKKDCFDAGTRIVSI